MIVVHAIIVETIAVAMAAVLVLLLVSCATLTISWAELDKIEPMIYSLNV